MPGWLVDTNVWLAAVFTTHPLHQVARDALQQATPAEPAVFCRASQLSFLRLASTPTLLKAYGAEGLTNRDALVALNALQALRQVSVREEPRGTPALWHVMSALDSASPKVWMDAYLAAFAIVGGLRMLTLDQDFRNFVPRGLALTVLRQL
mgnify:CR=1 FL=1